METLPPIPEKAIQKSILDYLAAANYVHWRNNSGVYRPQNRDGSTRFVRFGQTGTGDIVGLTKTGRFFSIEVKRVGKKPTAAQLEFMERVRKSNGIAILAYSLNDVLNHL